jgi:hypothetical protein
MVELAAVSLNQVDFFVPLCFENAMATYTRKMSYNFEEAYCSIWSFKYKRIHPNKKKQQTISKNITIFGDITQNLRKNCGILIKHRAISNSKKTLRIIAKSIQKGLPVLIHCDSFYNYWGPLFNKTHTSHMVFATSIDFIKKEICILDPSYSNETLYLHFNVLHKSTQFYFEIQKTNQKTKEIDTLFHTEFSNKKKYCGSSSIFSNIVSFAEDFRLYFDINKEYPGIEDAKDIENHFMNSLFTIQLNSILTNRNMLIIFLTYFYKHIKDKEESELIISAINHLHHSMSLWNNLKLKLLYCIMTKKYQKINDIGHTIIIDIYEEEQKAFKCISHFCN